MVVTVVVVVSSISHFFPVAVFTRGTRIFLLELQCIHSQDGGMEASLKLVGVHLTDTRPEARNNAYT